jgi:hypothetical protein
MDLEEKGAWRGSKISVDQVASPDRQRRPLSIAAARFASLFRTGTKWNLPDGPPRGVRRFDRPTGRARLADSYLLFRDAPFENTGGAPAG